MFLIANATMQHYPIIYCSSTFAAEFGYTRQEVTEQDAQIGFLIKRATSTGSKAQLHKAIQKKLSAQIEIILYVKSGEKGYT